MIYLSLSVNDIDSTIDFYTHAIRIFDSMSDSRLVCNSGIDFIIDLYEIGSERHRDVFGVDTHAPSSIAMLHGEGIKIKILDHLSKFGVEHKVGMNIAGHFLRLEDPTGNRISILAHDGGLV